MSAADSVVDVAGAFVDAFYSKLLSPEWKDLRQFYVPSAVGSRGDERSNSTGAHIAGVDVRVLPLL